MIGGNSLLAVRLQVELEKAGFKFNDYGALFKYKTIREMAEFIDSSNKELISI